MPGLRFLLGGLRLLPTQPFRNLPISVNRLHTRPSPMTYFPQQRPSRAPRISFIETTPAVVWCCDGCRKGKLQIVSVSCGLLLLSVRVVQVSLVRLLFSTAIRCVLVVEIMLCLVSCRYD